MSSLESFILLSDSLVEFENDFNEMSPQDFSSHSLEVHREEVRSIWANVKTAYNTCLREFSAVANGNDDGDDDVSSDLTSIKNRYRRTYHAYVRCVGKVGELIHERTVIASTPLDARPQETHGSNFRLPPCDMEVFNGDYLSWPSFRDMFTAIYIDNSRLSPVEKLFHLNQKTRGEARDIVKKAPLTNDGFSLAWKNLKDRFENKRILVNSQLRILFSLNPVTSESGGELKKLQRSIQGCISALQLYKIQIQNWDPIFVFLCSSRLPDATLALWEQSLKNKTAIPSWEELDLFLTSRYQTLETVSDIKASISSKSTFQKPSTSNSNSNRNSLRKISTYHTNMATPKCKICKKEQHTIRNCPQFLKMNTNERLASVKSLGLCLNCFAGSHSVKECKSTHNCFKCNKRHNTLLHHETTSFHSNSQPLRNSSNPQRSDLVQLQSTKTPNLSDTVQTCFASSSKSVLLGTALVQICHMGVTYSARALIDSGSEATFISEKLFKLLKLPSRSVNAQVSGLNNAIAAKTQKICSFVLRSPINAAIQIETSALVIPHLTGNLPTQTVDSAIMKNFPNIKLADVEFYRSSQIDLLIGGDLLPMVLLDGIQRNICGSLIAQETIFGWILTGPVKNVKSSSATFVSFFNEVALDEQISRFWEVEDLPQKHFITPSERFCEDLFVKTTKRGEDGRYVVALPFKEEYPEHIKIGHSRAIANAQFLRNEIRLSKNPEFKTQYDNVIQEYIDLNHMKAVSPPNYSHFPNHYYMPHHAVIKPESTTTKIRVVFNASSPASNSISLNDILHTGPVLQSDLTLLILKWRFFRFVFNSDIEKMYRQIRVDPSHTPFQRILFRNTPQSEIQDFELQTVTFGVNCAPYLAIRTLLQLANDVQSSFPLASSILLNSMYVDDVLAGSHDISTAIQARDELIAALGSAGFSLRKWTSNSKNILNGLPREHLLNEDFLQLDDCSTAKTLGIKWNAKLDEFYFSTKALEHKAAFTKREVLSQISKLFDPAGWLAPCIVLAKILMQRIWLSKVEWDENLPENCLQLWHDFLLSYPQINLIKVPRWVKFSPDCDVEFHAFCDASEKAYAAVIYIRIRSKSGIISTSLLLAKTKVAPVKTISIPRLELCGAVLLAEMVDAIIPSLDVKNYNIYFWTDSTIVLAWLQKPPCQWQTFVANRVSKIVQLVGPANWFHVNSQANPADLGSRGLLPQELINNDLWWHGPKWLKYDPCHWPTSGSISEHETDLEKKAIKSNFTFFQNFEDILDRFSSFDRAMRVIAYMIRFFNHTHPLHRTNFRHNSDYVTSSEIKSVKDRMIILSQKSSYPIEYKSLSAQKLIPSSSSLLNLNPFIDPTGIIRVCGRLISSPTLSYNERHPIIMPYNCSFTRLLVKFTHRISLHGGNLLVLRLIRLQFWIPRVKNLIKTTIHNCKTCVIQRQRVRTQLMGTLPPERTTLSRPFENTGLDFAGPFDIKNYTGRACLLTKGYVCVFVCFATKAIHLEATSTLSTPAFLAAFSRFVSRRGCPLNLYSDNGKTFVGASKELERNFFQASRAAIVSKFSHCQITWHFIPPGAPHMGGLWEAGVKSFKTHFKKVAGSFKYTFEELSTLLSKIEACLNSRPISTMTENSTDIAALTPGHFLVGGPLLAPIEPQIQEQPISIIKRWQRLTALQQHFCTRWKDEYLKELHKRNKWKRPQENIDINSIVVIRDENLPPHEWRLGRVSKVYCGKDRLVRVADVVTERGPITRPIVKLVLLPTN